MSEQTSPTRQCPACKSTVPAVVFCGACGADLGSPTDSWRVLLRPRTYAASPREPVFVPRLSSTLFPQIPARATRAYRIALVALLFCMAAMSALQWNVAVATISVLGVPMLFMLYAWEADVFQDARPQMVSALVLGTVIGLAWWWFSGYLLSHKYGVTTAAASAMENVIADEGLAVTLIGAALMILPLPLIRLIPARDADSLDGFVIGAGEHLPI